VPKPLPPRFYLGVDLGQTHDPSALVIARRVPPEGATDRNSDSDRPEGCTYEGVGLKRWPLGTPYPAIVADVKALLARPPLNDPETMLVLDATGVGKGVCDMFREAGMKPYAVTITGGFQVSREGYDVRVPKKDLVGVVMVLLQTGRLKIANRIPEAGVLRAELLAFRAKTTESGNLTLEAWRERDHDDMVLALACAVWAGENIVRHIIRFN
jgi:hypothetical protein